MFHVYILQSEKNKKYYIGSTSNLENRIKRHFEGRSKYTRKYLPYKLIYTEVYETKREALSRERYLKNLKNHRYIEKIITGQ